MGLMDKPKYGFYMMQICLVLKECKAELKVWQNRLKLSGKPLFNFD